MIYVCLTFMRKSNYYGNMRRLVLFFSYIATFAFTWTLALVPAYAQSICPKGANFGSLCNLKADKIGSVVGAVIQLLLVLAIILSLLFLIYGGVRYISSGGDKGKIDQARGTLTAAVVGLIISLLAFFVVSIVLVIITGQGLSTLTLPTLLQ